jgi:hypothetical protein
VKLTRLQRRKQLVNELWYHKLNWIWRADFHYLSWQDYFPNFSYVPEGIPKLSKPDQLEVATNAVKEVSDRLFEFVTRDNQESINLAKALPEVDNNMPYSRETPYSNHGSVVSSGDFHNTADKVPFVVECLPVFELDFIGSDGQPYCAKFKYELPSEKDLVNYPDYKSTNYKVEVLDIIDAYNNECLDDFQSFTPDDLELIEFAANSEVELIVNWANA